MRREEESEDAFATESFVWVGLSQSLPEGKQPRKQDMRSMVGLRGHSAD